MAVSLCATADQAIVVRDQLPAATYWERAIYVQEQFAMGGGMTGQRKPSNSARDIFSMPALIGIISTAGLAAALLGD